MRKMIQSKSLLFAVSLFSIGAVVSVAQATPQSTNQPSATGPAEASRPANQSEQRQAPVQMAENVTTNRGDRMICKQEIILGTRLKGLRTCRTASEWRRVARGFQLKLKEANDRGAAVYSGN